MKRRLLISLTLVLALALVNVAGVTGAAGAQTQGAIVPPTGVPTTVLGAESDLPIGIAGDPYALTLSSNYGGDKVTWSANFPSGIGFTQNATMARVTGTPSSAGRYDVKVTAKDEGLETTWVYNLVILPKLGKMNTRGSEFMYTAASSTTNGKWLDRGKSVEIIGYTYNSSTGIRAEIKVEGETGPLFLPIEAIIDISGSSSSNNNNSSSSSSSSSSSYGSGRYSYNSSTGQYYSDPYGKYYYDSSRGQYRLDPSYSGSSYYYGEDRYSYSSTSGYYPDPYGVYYYDAYSSRYVYDPTYAGSTATNNRYSYDSYTGTYYSDPYGYYYYNSSTSSYVYDPFNTGSSGSSGSGYSSRYSFNSSTGTYYADPYGYYYYNGTTGSYVYDPYYNSSSYTSTNRYSYNSANGTYYADPSGLYYYDSSINGYRYDPTYSYNTPSYSTPSQSTPGTGAYARVIVRSVNTYAGPGASYAVMGTLAQNELVQIAGYSTDRLWAKTSLGTWVHTSYIQMTTAASGTGNYVVNVRSSLNVRSGPGTSYSSIGQLRSGASVEVISTTGGWSQIRHSSGVGYVSSAYLTYSGNAVG